MQESALSTFGVKNIASRICERFKKELELRMTDPEAAKLCDVSVRTIQNWKSKVPIPSDKLALFGGAGLDLNYILLGEVARREDGSSDSDNYANVGSLSCDVEKSVALAFEAIKVCEEHHIVINETNVVAVGKSILKNADRDDETKKVIFETLASILN